MWHSLLSPPRSLPNCPRCGPTHRLQHRTALHRTPLMRCSSRHSRRARRAIGSHARAARHATRSHGMQWWNWGNSLGRPASKACTRAAAHGVHLAHCTAAGTQPRQVLGAHAWCVQARPHPPRPRPSSLQHNHCVRRQVRAPPTHTDTHHFLKWRGCHLETVIDLAHSESCLYPALRAFAWGTDRCSRYFRGGSFPKATGLQNSPHASWLIN